MSKISGAKTIKRATSKDFRRPIEKWCCCVNGRMIVQTATTPFEGGFDYVVWQFVHDGWCYICMKNEINTGQLKIRLRLLPFPLSTTGAVHSSKYLSVSLGYTSKESHSLQPFSFAELRQAAASLSTWTHYFSCAAPNKAWLFRTGTAGWVGKVILLKTILHGSATLFAFSQLPSHDPILNTNVFFIWNTRLSNFLGLLVRFLFAVGLKCELE